MAVALLLAAGRGERLGAATPKAFVELCGQPLLQWSLDVLAGVRAIERIVLALPEGVTAAPEVVTLPAHATCVPGGAVRSASVRQALAAVGAGDPVLVHDAARPLLTAELVQRTLNAVGDEIDAAIAAAPVTDTIKRAARTQAASSGIGDASAPTGICATATGASSAAELPIVSETLDRSGLWAVQTPQVFGRAALERALDVPDEVLAQATDDAWLIERAGGSVAIVASGSENMKVTTASDLALAELLLAERKALRPD